MPIRVSIVEDLAEVREGLVDLVQSDKELFMVSSFKDAESAAQKLPGLKADIVVMDINLPGMSGIECIRSIKEKCPGTQFMMFTVYENNDQVFEALKAGATGYLLKKTAPAQIIEGIKDLFNGGSPMSATIARKLVTIFQEQPKGANSEASVLTNRERDVLECLAKGMLYKEIAEQLGISFHTVRQHIRKMYEKLHVQNKTEAINKVYGNRI